MGLGIGRVPSSGSSTVWICLPSRDHWNAVTSVASTGVLVKRVAAPVVVSAMQMCVASSKCAK